MKRTQKKQLNYPALAVEITLISLALGSLILLAFDTYADLTVGQELAIIVYDRYVGAIFLVEFIFRWWRSGSPKAYFTKHWYLLLAAIPVAGGVAQLLRIVRLEGVVRLLQASDHFVAEKAGK